MAVPTYPSAISLNDVQTEFGGANPISISEYYSGGSYVGSGTANSTGTTIPTSGQISFLNFSGSVAYVVDPTQPTVTRDHYHGTWSWGAQLPADLYITTSGHLVSRLSDAKTIWVLDGSGAKVWANTAQESTAQRLTHSFRNPYYGYINTWRTTGPIINKIANTGVVVKSSNVNFGAANTNPYIYAMAVSSGTSNANTAIYPMMVSNTNTGNATYTICKINAADMLTVDWAKTTVVTPTDSTANVKLYNAVFMNHNESAVVISGYRGTTNTCVIILNANTGATEQSWQTAYNYSILPKPTSANNVALLSSIYLTLKSNTGANVANLFISNTSWRVGYGYDIDYDSNIYGYAQMQQGNTATYHVMVAKYNSSGTRQWQVRIESLTSSNGVQVVAFAASNTMVALAVREFTEAHDGKKWYTASTGEVRYLHIDAVSGNTGTMGRFSLTSNTTTVWGAGTGNTGMWSYTYNPRSTYDFTLASNTNPTYTSNSATFTKTAL